MKLSAIRVLVAGVVAAGAFSSAFAQQEATGAGASFPAPLYSKWDSDYNKATGVKINYQSVGSGAGLRQIEAKTVDFGASDAPLKDEDLNKKGLVQFPTVIGGVVPVVNIKGIAPGQIKLSGQVLGDIYLGKISNWSDPAIKALNPGVALPDASIAQVAGEILHRLPLAERPVLLIQIDAVTTQFGDADVEGDPGAQGGLLEQGDHALARQGLAVFLRIGLDRLAKRQQRLDLGLA